MQKSVLLNNLKNSQSSKLKEEILQLILEFLDHHLNKILEEDKEIEKNKYLWDS